MFWVSSEFAGKLMHCKMIKFVKCKWIVQTITPYGGNQNTNKENAMRKIFFVEQWNNISLLLWKTLDKVIKLRPSDQ